MTLGQTIHTALTERYPEAGTLLELARAAGLPHSTLDAWRVGHRDPTGARAAALAQKHGLCILLDSTGWTAMIPETETAADAAWEMT